MIHIDHIGIAARDAQGSARALADILGADEPTPDGADDDMFRIQLADGASLLFNPATTVPPAHVAFRGAPVWFAGVVARLRERGVPFGNDPEAADNGQTDDPLGGAGRVYFRDADGHLFEVTC